MAYWPGSTFGALSLLPRRSGYRSSAPKVSSWRIRHEEKKKETKGSTNLCGGQFGRDDKAISFVTGPSHTHMQERERARLTAPSLNWEMIPGSLLGAGKSSLLRYGIYDGKEPRHKSQNPEIWDARERPPSYSTSPREKPGTFISTYWWIHLHRCVCVCVFHLLLYGASGGSALSTMLMTLRVSLSLSSSCVCSICNILAQTRENHRSSGRGPFRFFIQKRKNLEWWRAEAQDLRRRMKRELMTSRHWKFFFVSNK